MSLPRNSVSASSGCAVKEHIVEELADRGEVAIGRDERPRLADKVHVVALLMCARRFSPICWLPDAEVSFAIVADDRWLGPRRFYLAVGFSVLQHDLSHSLHRVFRLLFEYSLQHCRYAEVEPVAVHVAHLRVHRLWGHFVLPLRCLLFTRFLLQAGDNDGR
jgi:hypothetical protein